MGRVGVGVGGRGGGGMQVEALREAYGDMCALQGRICEAVRVYTYVYILYMLYILYILYILHICIHITHMYTYAYTYACTRVHMTCA